MKSVTKHLFSLLPILLVVLLFNACGKKDASTDSKTTDSKTTTTSSGNDADAMIDQYESLMKEYVALVKAVKGGDYNQTAKMQELSTKTQEWSKKLADQAPKLTAAQQERISKISQMASDQMQ